MAGLKELYLELVCKEPNVFLLDAPESLSLLFAPEDAPSATAAQGLADGVTEVIRGGGVINEAGCFFLDGAPRPS